MIDSSKKLRTMIITALFAAIIGILAQISIPLPFTQVPITGQTLAIGLVATILGAKIGTVATLLYIIIGSAGIPVFAQFTAGLGVLFGPTGGFLVGFIPTVFFIGFFLERFGFTITNALIANIVGMFITLSFGTVWLKIVADLTWMAAFVGGFAPFIFVGIIKAFIASWLGIVVRKRLVEARLLIIATNAS